MTTRPALTMLTGLTALTALTALAALGTAACSNEAGPEPPPIHAPQRPPPEDVVLVPEVGGSLVAAPTDGDAGATDADLGGPQGPAPSEPSTPPAPPEPPPPAPLDLAISSGAGDYSILAPSSPVCSAVGGANAFTLTNARPVAVEVVWINYQCNEVSYGVVQPGATVYHPTYAGHRWRLRSADGVAPRDFVLGTPGAQYTVTAR